MKKFDTARLIGFIGVGLSAIAMAISNWSNEKQMERMIEEKVEERFAKKQEEEES